MGTVYVRPARTEILALKIAHLHFPPQNARHAGFPTEPSLMYRLLSMTLIFLKFSLEFTRATQTLSSIQLLEVTTMQKPEIGHSLLQGAL